MTSSIPLPCTVCPYDVCVVWRAQKGTTPVGQGLESAWVDRDTHQGGRRRGIDDARRGIDRRARDVVDVAARGVAATRVGAFVARARVG